MPFPVGSTLQTCLDRAPFGALAPLSASPYSWSMTNCRTATACMPTRKFGPGED